MIKKDGMTLVELLIVILCVSIVATLTLPAFSSILVETTLHTQATSIASTLRRTQNLAITTGTHHRFEINLNSKVYRIREPNSFIPPLLSLKIDDQIIEIRCNFMDVGGGWRRIEYTPTGIPSQTGEIVIFDRRGRGRAIIAAVGTGRVRIEERRK